MNQNHTKKYEPVASGAGRIKCSCGWLSRISDDGLMFSTEYVSPSHLEGDWNRHVAEATADARYPEGFDASCGIEAKYMQEANRVLAGLIGKREWDVPHLAYTMQALAKEAK